MEASLTQTPTWVVAAVCLAIVSVSLAAERFLHYLGKSFKHKEKKTLYSALLRLKEELMLLGFISFLLSVFQGIISHICIPKSATYIMLPCKKENYEAAEETTGICKNMDDVPLLSKEALHQLHIFVFVLGLVHVVFCATTILLGGAKMRTWRKWETEFHQEIKHKPGQTGQTELERKTTPLYNRLHYNHQGKFVSERTKGFWMKLDVASWIISFSKQFYDSVNKSDYGTLRAAFVLIHYPKYPKFDFHNYMIRALEHDFKRVVGISWYLWLFVILFLLLNINGWHTYFWLAFLPLFLLLIVGAKLEHIITRLAQEAAAAAASPDEAGGAPKRKPSKEHFWFHKPEFVLHLIHFILFQNSFEIGFFFWVSATYGFNACIMEKKLYSMSRLIVGILIEVLCGYSTLPLYGIVTHMSGDLKLQAFGEHVAETIQGWAMDTREKMAKPSGGETCTEVEVTRAPNGFLGISGNMLEPPELEEIVTPAAVTTGDERCLSRSPLPGNRDVEKFLMSDASEPAAVALV